MMRTCHISGVLARFCVRSCEGRTAFCTYGQSVLALVRALVRETLRALVRALVRTLVRPVNRVLELMLSGSTHLLERAL
eukprot:6180409-Pleurochrysis_carterae.AAC.1